MEYWGFVIEMRLEKDCHIARVRQKNRKKFLAKGPQHADFCLVEGVDTLAFQSEAEAITEAKFMAEACANKPI
jgi:hypothetical protein